MKILHTSDWHLGHRLHEQLQHDEQQRFLGWLCQCVAERQVDVLLVSGDVFDNGAPSAQSLKMYYDFLVGLRSTGCKRVVITAGNHDAHGTIDAPRELLNALNISVVGKAGNAVDQEIVSMTIGGEELLVAAVPFLRDQDIRRAVSGESFELVSERYNRAIVQHYRSVADACAARSPRARVVAMGHLFATGAAVTGSEQSIYVGNLGDISAREFPASFCYVALGHLHKPQKVGGMDHIRYSGSPVALSFSEVGQQKCVLLVEVAAGENMVIEEVPVPQFRKLAKLCGTFDACVAGLQAIHEERNELRPWVEVELETSAEFTHGFADVSKAAEHLDLDVLKVSYKNQPQYAGIDALVDNRIDIKELDPVEVFRLKCNEMGFNLDENKDIMDAYHEVLQLLR